MWSMVQLFVWLLQDLKCFEKTGFYQDVHYTKVDKQGSTDVCLLLIDKLHSSLESVEEAEGVLFVARELSMSINGRPLPGEVEQRCTALHNSDNHDNVATFLGMVVDKYVQPRTHSVALIFEEYAEGGWRYKYIIYCICVLLQYITQLCVGVSFDVVGSIRTYRPNHRLISFFLSTWGSYHICGLLFLIMI